MRLVLPTIKAVAWLLIAGALITFVVLQSLPEPEPNPAKPGINLETPTVAAETGTITNTVVLSGSVVNEPATEVRATTNGTVSMVWLEAGAQVNVGDPLITVKTPVDPPPAAEPTLDPETGEPTSPEPPPEPTFTYSNVVATTAGKLSKLEPLLGQDVSIGSSIASIDRGQLLVQGTVAPDAQYRLTSLPKSAMVEVAGGPKPFDCGSLRVAPAGASERESGSDGDAASLGGASPGSTSSGITISCAVPSKTKVFPGAAACMTLAAGEAADVVTVPVTAVQGRSGSGTVWKLDTDDKPQATEVTLGLSDGARVEIRKGLKEGDQILEFIPLESANAPARENGSPAEGPGGGSAPAESPDAGRGNDGGLGEEQLEEDFSE